MSLQLPVTCLGQRLDGVSCAGDVEGLSVRYRLCKGKLEAKGSFVEQGFNERYCLIACPKPNSCIFVVDQPGDRYRFLFINLHHELAIVSELRQRIIIVGDLLSLNHVLSPEEDSHANIVGKTGDHHDIGNHLAIDSSIGLCGMQNRGSASSVFFRIKRYNSPIHIPRRMCTCGYHYQEYCCNKNTHCQNLTLMIVEGITHHLIKIVNLEAAA